MSDIIPSLRQLLAMTLLCVLQLLQLLCTLNNNNHKNEMQKVLNSWHWAHPPDRSRVVLYCVRSLSGRTR